MNAIEYLASALLGTRKGRNAYRQARASRPDIFSGLAELQKNADPAREADAHPPVFLLSAGWRSGSTLLQRLIMTDPRVMIWGEPYDECGILQAMAEPLKAFRPGWPPDDYIYREGVRPAELTGAWIANLFPDTETLRRGYRAFLETTFGDPARRAGAVRWGIKEVRLDAAHGAFLRWLYPESKIVFLYRNPLSAYRSYCRYGRDWYDVWPDRPILTPWAFGRHWRRLMDDFLANASRLDALVLSYEDLTRGGGEVIDRLERHLDATLDRTLLDTKVGTSERGGRKPWVSKLETAILRRAVGPVAKRVGYSI